MYYAIQGKKWGDPTIIEAWDGIVIKAPPQFGWAISKPISSLLYWCDSKRIRVRASDSFVQLIAHPPYKPLTTLKAGTT